MVSQTTYFERPAYRLSDGKTEAVIVPQLGRILRYGKVGGPNLLWSASTKDVLSVGGWKNYGGDKNWLAPQSAWKIFHGKDSWPPETALDGSPQTAEVLTGGKLRLTTPVSPGTGIHLQRTLFFSDAGELVIEQTAFKTKGSPVRAAIWSITQTIPGDAIFLPLNPNSAYKNGYFWIGAPNLTQEISSPQANLLKIVPKNTGGGAKIGLDSSVSSLASVWDGVAFVQKSAKPKGNYPDGAEGAGFPVELYINGATLPFNCELEILGPLVNFYTGSQSTHTVRWSLHDLPSKDIDSPAVQKAIEKLLFNP